MFVVKIQRQKNKALQVRLPTISLELVNLNFVWKYPRTWGRVKYSVQNTSPRVWEVGKQNLHSIPG